MVGYSCECASFGGERGLAEGSGESGEGGVGVGESFE